MPTITEADIAELVGRFYDRIRADASLAPVFQSAIGGTDAEWGPHLAVMRRFWSSVMLGSGTYRGDPYSVHRRLTGLTPEMFDRWLGLFDATCTEHFPPDTAAAFSERAHRIARSLKMGLFPYDMLPAQS